MHEIVFINSFEVPVDRDEDFLLLWKEIDDYMRGKPGYRWRRLHRSVDPGSRLRYVNVAGWESAEHFDAAHDETFRRLQSQPGWAHFPAYPSLYTVVQEDASTVPAAGS